MFARSVHLAQKKICHVYLFIYTFFFFLSPVEWVAFRNIQGSYTSAAKQEQLLLERRNASLFPEFSRRDILIG